MRRRSPGESESLSIVRDRILCIRELASSRLLKRRRFCDAGAGADAEAVAAAGQAVGEGAASLRGLRRWAARASTDHWGWRRAEGARSRWHRADVLAEGTPVESLVAELDVEIAARAEEIDARGAERWRRVGLHKIKQAGAGVAWVGDGD